MWRWQLKLVEVVTVAHVDGEKRVDNSLVQIWKVKFGLKVMFLFRLWAQDLVRLWGQDLVKIFKLVFRQGFETDVCSLFCYWYDAWLWLWSSIFVEIVKLGLVKIFKFSFCRNADIWLWLWIWCLVEILNMFDQDLCKNLWYDPKKLLW